MGDQRNCLDKKRRDLQRVSCPGPDGIVPQGIVPAYCGKLFPDEIVIDYFNLHLDMGSRAVSRIHWYPEKKLIPASP